MGLVWSESTQNTPDDTISPQRGGLSLTLTDQGQTYNPKCIPKWLPHEALGFSWDGSSHSAHSTVKFCDWSVSNQEQISLVEMFSLIS